ncbi:hypothetical protein [Paenibacillus naphthalenovorans]|uniref:hypothetical protein n=1 Tax=Paenibacillus naphthalenovorans TaxID=162209 RepID=UPI000ABEF88D|nr:hypothetical protein [Paenibacillus naphthalenovorans]
MAFLITFMRFASTPPVIKEQEARRLERGSGFQIREALLNIRTEHSVHAAEF